VPGSVDVDSVSEVSDVRRASVFRFDSGGGGPTGTCGTSAALPSPPGANSQDRLCFGGPYFICLIQSV
jgi:hypothetical protein